ncbi:hypothetical protein KBW81_04695 [Loktanella salsilacus]|uniref:hypothetical protein n=1 Tax=Loktanella salsilacus TaxID=195913 RepID=UPI0020B67A92|nr:hypothetical protein [Loktanella salsilacus]UTH49094.1 hypothetical protein KBW81_04695 [Loktanella salsilacus]
MGFPFSESEFSIVGQTVDYDEYIKLWGIVGSETSEEIIDRHERVWASLEAHGVDKLSADRQADKEEVLREAQIADKLRYIEMSFQPLIDRATAKAFGALSEGTLKSEAWLLTDIDDPEAEPQTVEVPASSWTLKGFSLTDSSLICRSDKYHAVRVNLNDAFTLFDRPGTSAIPANGQVFGDTMLIETDHPVMQHRRPVGRPPKGNASARDVIKNVFHGRLRRGELPGKKEAQIQEVIEFAREAFGEELSRTTAQSYLKSIL